MKVTIIDGAGKRHAVRVAENGEFVTLTNCPECGSGEPTIRGTGITHHDHDTYYARAVARCCGSSFGMETKVDTIFGIEEDEAVLLRGRARVYR